LLAIGIFGVLAGLMAGCHTNQDNAAAFGYGNRAGSALALAEIDPDLTLAYPAEDNLASVAPAAVDNMVVAEPTVAEAGNQPENQPVETAEQIPADEPAKAELALETVRVGQKVARAEIEALDEPALEHVRQVPSADELLAQMDAPADKDAVDRRVQEILKQEREIALEEKERPVWTRKVEQQPAQEMAQGVSGVPLPSADLSAMAPAPVPAVETEKIGEEQATPPAVLSPEMADVEIPGEAAAETAGDGLLDQVNNKEKVRKLLADSLGQEPIAANGEKEKKDPEPGVEPEPEDPAKAKLRALAAREKILAEARRQEALAKYQAGLGFFKQKLFNEALKLFEEALKLSPELAEARSYRDNCYRLLGRPSTDKAEMQMVRVGDMERAKIESVEMQMTADLEMAEKLFVAAKTPSETRLLLMRDEQIADSLGDLHNATNKLRQVDGLLSSSPLPSASQKGLRLRVKALLAMVTELKDKLVAERNEMDIAKSKSDAENAKQESLSLHNKRLERLMESAEYHFGRKEYDKARDLCRQILKMDPHDIDAKVLLQQCLAEAHKKADFDTSQALHDSEITWAQAAASAAITPSDDVVYPANWEQIKLRQRRQRDRAVGSESERQIRDKLETKRMSIDYIRVPVTDVARDLAEKSGINILWTPGVEEAAPEVTLTVAEMTLGKILDWTMKLTDLHYQISNEAILISTEPRSRVILQLYPVFDLTRGLKDYKPVEDDDDDDDDDEEEEEINIVEDIKTFVAPESWEQEGVNLEIWQDNLLVMQTPEVHAEMSAYLDGLRESSKQQVLVEGRFLNVTSNFLEEIGVTWTSANPGAPRDKQGDGIYSSHTDDGRVVTAGVNIEPGQGAAGGTTYNSGLNLNLGYLSTGGLRQFEVNAMIHALNETTQGSVLHNPRLLVTNGRNAFLKILTTTNYVARYEQQSHVYQPVIEQYDQGITWSVRPVISFDRKYITIRVRPKIVSLDTVNSRNGTFRQSTLVADTGAVGGGVVDDVDYPFLMPVIITTQLETNITLPDGGTVLMGGLIRDAREEASTGVPLISSIPILGRLTRSENVNHEKETLVVMVQGKIIELD